MATLGTYFYDGTNFSAATVLCTDSSLTIPAPDGWYSQGGIYRQVSLGVLGLLQTCASCGYECDEPAIGTSNFGKFYVTVDMGATVGAVVAEFTVGAAANARCTWTYNSIIASEYSSPVFGYCQGVIGDENCCGLSNATGSGGTSYTGTEYINSGSVFTPLGPPGNWGPYLDQLSGGVTLQPGGSFGAAIMVIPKTSAVLNTIVFEIDSPMTGSAAWSLKVNCPGVLDSFEVSSFDVNCTDLCTVSPIPPQTTYYHARVDPTQSLPGFPAIHDWIFLDDQGVTIAPDGFYLVSTYYPDFTSCTNCPEPNPPGVCMSVENGVVKELRLCVP